MTKTVSFEYVLSRSSDWLEDLRQVMVDLSEGEPIALPPSYTADMAEGLRIIVSHLNAMQAALPAPPEAVRH
jgi:hypothetical protein